MSDYNTSQVDWLRPPEVEGEQGDWSSRWLISVERTADVVDLSGSEVHEDVCEFTLIDLGDCKLRLELRSVVHPLDLEGYEFVDAGLQSIDDRSNQRLSQEKLASVSITDIG